MQLNAPNLAQVDWSAAGKGRLLSGKGDPFLFARWERVVFLHFTVEPMTLRPQVPSPFELELYGPNAVISVVAVTMSRFRPVRRALLAAWPFTLISRQSFLNLRTYVRLGDEPGALFLWGWLSQPCRLSLPSGVFALPYAFATLRYRHQHETGPISGVATSPRLPGRLAYHARMDAGATFEPCEPGSMSEFAMERYTGFFCRGDEVYRFRAWHAPWLQTPIAAEIEERSLLDGANPWFRRAKLVGAHYAPGFEQVWMGKAHRIDLSSRTRHRGLRTFFEMP